MITPFIKENTKGKCIGSNKDRDIIQSKCQDIWSTEFLQFLKSNLDKQLIPSFVTFNPNVTWKTIKSLKQYNWDWEVASQKENISLVSVLANPDYPWNWNQISKKGDVTHKNSTAFSAVIFGMGSSQRSFIFIG